MGKFQNLLWNGNSEVLIYTKYENNLGFTEMFYLFKALQWPVFMNSSAKLQIMTVHCLEGAVVPNFIHSHTGSSVPGWLHLL